MKSTLTRRSKAQDGLFSPSPFAKTMVALAAGGAVYAAQAQQTLGASETTQTPAMAQPAPRAASAASAAASSGAGSIEQSQTQTVTVTASRRHELATEVPVSLSVVMPDTLLQKGMYDINGVADLVPNLRTTSGGSPSFGNMTIRGVFSGSDPTVGIYIDDVPYGPVVGGAGSSLAFDGTLFDVSRIEVVRGPQGTLFGAGSMGGVVRYVTDAPSLEGIKGSASLDVSDTHRGGTNTLVRGKLSVPIIEDKLGVSVSVFDSHPQGYIDQPGRDATKVNGSVWKGGLISALYTPTEDTSIRVNFMAHKATYDSGGTEGFNPQTGKPLLGEYTDIETLPTPRELDFNLASAVLEHHFSFAEFSSVTSEQHLKFSNQTDLTAAFGPTADALAPAGAPHHVGFVSAFDTKRFTQEFRLTSPRVGNIEWLVGAYYTDQHTADIQNVLLVPNDLNLLTSSNPDRYTEEAAFGNLTYYLTPEWDVTGGLRLASNKTTISSDATGLLVTPLAQSTTSDSVATYLLNTRYRVSTALALYARAASGYRPAGVNLTTLDTSGNRVGQPSYSSDKLWSYEVGAKGVLPGTKLTYDIDAYYLDWKQAQIAVTFPSGLGGLGNALGGVQGHGFEAALSGDLIKNLSITGSLGITRTALKTDEPSLGGLAGEALPGNPTTTAALLADYALPSTAGIKWTVGGTWRYTGRYTSSFNGGTGAGGTTITPPQPNFNNPSFTQEDVRFGAQYGALTATLYCTNITDKHAYQTVLPVSATYAQGVVLRPRTVGLNLRYDFQ